MTLHDAIIKNSEHIEKLVELTQGMLETLDSLLKRIELLEGK